MSYRLIQDGMKDKLVGFAVTEMDVNPDELLVLPVKKIDEYANYNYDTSEFNYSLNIKCFSLNFNVKSI